MNTDERNKMLLVFKKYTNELKNDKKRSIQFLYEIGLVTKNGKIKKEWNHKP